MGKRKRKVGLVTAMAPSVPGRGESRSDSKEKRKTNLKPKCLDEQEIPYRLREIMKSRDELRNPKIKKKRKASKGSEGKPGSQALASLDDIPVPKFKRHKQESEGAYIQRMEQESKHVLFLTKTQLQREPEKEEPVQENVPKKKNA
uniref:Uncharacterized protein n=1 Tax=Sphenodon punctatus TaxID=8508 RepID=A0A8D0HEP0_SPHPU